MCRREKKTKTEEKEKQEGKRANWKKKIDRLPPSKRILLKRSFGTMITMQMSAR